MRLQSPIAVLIGIWLVWAVCLIGFQEIVQARVRPDRPDRVLAWTPTETGLRRAAGKPYLQERTLQAQVAWDSEFYLSIATVGYDDPEATAMDPPGTSVEIPLNYAFLPGYPMAIRIVAAPLRLMGVAPIAAGAIAGVTVSLAATLGAMLALFRLARAHLDESTAIRAAFYLLVFPTGFFLAQVYSEGLFLALAFGSLALAADRRPMLAALLAVLATLTRPVGIALVVPLALAGFEAVRRTEPDARDRLWKLGAWGVAIVAPVVAYLAWSWSSLGQTFEVVQREYFGRGTFNIGTAWDGWSRALGGLGEAAPETRVYYGLETTAVVLAVVASVWAFRRWPGPALFGLAALVISLTSGEPQGMIRYVLAVPAIFLLLARLGTNAIFDRGWTMASTLLMALLAALWTWDFWVA